MRANLKYFLARLGLVACASLGLTAISFAHDLPDAKALNASTASAASTTSTTSTASELPHVVHAQLDGRLSVARPDVGVAPRPTVSETQLQRLIAVARPDSGVAPQPVVQVAQAATQHQLVPQKTVSARASEVYMPYDFQLSDWRFGQFPYHGKSASAPSQNILPTLADDMADVNQSAQLVEAPFAGGQSSGKSDADAIPTKAPTPKLAVKYGPASPQSAALGEFLQQVEQWQCTTYSVLKDTAALAQTIEGVSQSLGQLAINYRQDFLEAYPPAELTAAPVPVVEQSSPKVGPQFVIYDAAHGGHMVLTVEQAREWQFDATAVQSRVNNALGAALKPIQSSVLATASRQLELAGRGLLSLSHTLSSISADNQAQAKVASLPSHND